MLFQRAALFVVVAIGVASTACGGPSAMDASTDVTLADAGASDACSGDAGPMQWIAVGTDGGFIERSTGRRYVPWGFNYDHDRDNRLIEEYWLTDWSAVDQDFHEIKALGATVVRIHLQFAEFMTNPTSPNATSLAQLRRLAHLAESLDLRLDLTGLASYRAAAQPSWYVMVSESARWEMQAAFWEAVASTVADCPSVFAYDLMNEPFVPAMARAPGAWLQGDLGGFSYVQAITLDPAGRDRATIATDWITRMTTAIRRHDRAHLVTVGLLPGGGSGFDPMRVAPVLDYLSVHIYPDSMNLMVARDALSLVSVGKPVVIEELFGLQCTTAELRQFILDSRTQAAGWMGFYWGKTEGELQASGTIGDAIMLDWLRLFRELTPTLLP